MYVLPTTLRRSYLGLFLIFIAGSSVELFMVYLSGYIASQAATAPFVPMLAIFVAVLVGLITIVAIYVYWNGKLLMTDDGLQVTRYTTLFWSTQSSVDWKDIQEVTIQAPGILKSLTGVGTILVQSAGALPNLSISWIGNVDELRDFIAHKAEQADSGL